MEEIAEVICGTIAGYCICGLEPDHKPPHSCTSVSDVTGEQCKGKWEGEWDLNKEVVPSNFTPIEMPG